LAGRLIQDRYTARDTVSQAARFAQKQIGLPPAAVVLEYVAAAAGGLDDYSSFLTRDQLDEVYSQIEGNFVGLGIELKSNEGELLIVKVITGSPAQRAGLRGGDRIVAVDGRTTADLSTDGAADLLQGPEGSSVAVSILSPGQTAARAVSVRREHVEIPSVDDVKLVDPTAGVGYIRLNCFQKTTTRDVDAALWKLHREGMRSLVLDLRGNPGGLLTAAVELVDKFVERGTIVSTRGRNRQEDFNYAAHKPGTWRVPLVVLIDGESASASEIFAGAIRDHRRGTIVGQKSYGKGSVQGIFPLNQAGAGVRLTTAMFYSPSGQRISKVGVSPDLEVRTVARPTGNGAPATPAEDAGLTAAVQAARNQVARRATTGGVGQ
jgi:carboxyl-terminal processing protease